MGSEDWLQRVFETPKLSAPPIQLPPDTSTFAATAPLFVSVTPMSVGYVEPGVREPNVMLFGDSEIWQPPENVMVVVLKAANVPLAGAGT